MAEGPGNLLTITANDWGDVSVRALTRTLLAVTVTLSSGYAFKVVRCCLPRRAAPPCEGFRLPQPTNSVAV